MNFQMKYQITARPLSKPSRRRSGAPISPAVKFVVAHDSGNPNATAAQNVAYYQRSRDQMAASAHLFVDDREIVECIPALAGDLPEKAWHVLYSVPTDNQLYGYDANDAAIGVEYCFGDRIDADEAYRKYVWVLAYACHRFDLDPATRVVGHFFLDPHRRTDPVTGLAHSRRTYEQLLRDIVDEYRACRGEGTGGPPSPLTVETRSGTVVTTVALNIRRGAPSSRAEIHQTVPRGSRLDYVVIVANGQALNCNPVWYGDANGNYFWSGGTTEAATT